MLALALGSLANEYFFISLALHEAPFLHEVENDDKWSTSCNLLINPVCQGG